MTEEKPLSDGFDPDAVIAEVEGISNAMVNSTEAPRGFMLALVALIAAVLALITVVPWPVILGLSALGIPLGIWYYFVMRKRPKPRRVINHSGPYILYFVLFMLVTQFSRFLGTRDMVGSRSQVGHPVWGLLVQHVPHAHRDREQSSAGCQ